MTMPPHQARSLDRLVSLALTLLVTAFCLLPLVWMVSTSVKPMGSEYLKPVEMWPAEPSLQGYRAALLELNFVRPLLNSVLVSLAVAAGCLLVSAPAAYAVARLRFRYKIQSLLLLQLGAMIPPVVIIAPTFGLLRALGLLGTLPAMILPNIFYNVPLATWLLASYFAELPAELEDAAKVDGYRPLQVFWKVTLPLAKPALFAAGMFAFIGSYGEFMLASVVTLGRQEALTAPVAIQNFAFAFRQQWTWISAGVVLALIPVLLLALIFQRWVVKGLTAGAVKY